LRWQRGSRDLGQFSHLPMGSLGGYFGGNKIGEAGARELLTALQFNKTLAKLQ
jgi:hypothetical protein